MKKSTSKPPKPQATPSKVPTQPAASARGRGAKEDDYDASYYRQRRLRMAAAALIVGLLVISIVVTIVSPFLMGR